MPEPKNRPTERKVWSQFAGSSYGGSITIIIAWLCEENGIVVPPEVAAAFAAILIPLAGFIFGWRTAPEGNEQTLREANQSIELVETRGKYEREKVLRRVEKLTGKTEDEIMSAGLDAQPEGA